MIFILLNGLDKLISYVYYLKASTIASKPKCPIAQKLSLLSIM